MVRRYVVQVCVRVHAYYICMGVFVCVYVNVYFYVCPHVDFVCVCVSVHIKDTHTKGMHTHNVNASPKLRVCTRDYIVIVLCLLC